MRIGCFKVGGSLVLVLLIGGGVIRSLLLIALTPLHVCLLLRDNPIVVPSTEYAVPDKRRFGMKQQRSMSSTEQVWELSSTRMPDIGVRAFVLAGSPAVAVIFGKHPVLTKRI
jgi:hypothetical protein